MRIRGTQTRYGIGARIGHWATAAGMIFLFGSGFVMRRVLEIPNNQVAIPIDLQSRLHTLHVIAGFVVTAVATARLLWMRFDRRPAPPDLPKVRLALFTWVHRLLYSVAVVSIVTGTTMVVRTYRQFDPAMAPERVGQWIWTLSIWDFKGIAGVGVGLVHIVSAWTFVVLLGTHLVGMITHQRKTGEPLRRMLRPRRREPQTSSGDTQGADRHRQA
jgi:cytochrome b561